MKTTTEMQKNDENEAEGRDDADGEEEEGEEEEFKKYWIAHGVCASIAWTIFVPLAIGSSLLRKQFVRAGFGEDTWFQVHRGLNSLAAILTIIAFSLAVHVIRQEDGKSEWTEEPHFTVGLVIFISMLVQVTIAYFRPHKHNVEPEEETKAETKAEESASGNADAPPPPQQHGSLTLRTVQAPLLGIEFAGRFVVASSERLETL